MPTVKKDNASSHDVNDVIADDQSASHQETHQDDSGETGDDQLDSTELRKKYADARKGMDAKAKENKLLKAELAKLKTLADIEDDAEAEEDEPVSLSKKDLEHLKWELKNEDRIALVEETYKKILKEGYDGEKLGPKSALELAEKLEKVETANEVTRQATMSTTSVVNRDDTTEIVLTEAQKKRGITPETIAKYKADVENMG